MKNLYRQGGHGKDWDHVKKISLGTKENLFNSKNRIFKKDFTLEKNLGTEKILNYRGLIFFIRKI